MYSILVDGEILYHPMMTNDGYAISSGTVTVEMDKTGSAEIVVPGVNPSVTDCKKMISMIQFMDDDRELFRGRILNDDRDFNNNKTMYIEGELAFMLDHILSPYDRDIIVSLWGSRFQNEFGHTFRDDSANPKRPTVGDYFRYFISVYNSQCDKNRRLRVGEITAAKANTSIDELIIAEDAATAAYEARKAANPDLDEDPPVEDENIIRNYEYPNIWDEINDQIIGKYGGHIRTRCDSTVRLGNLSDEYSCANIFDDGTYGGSDRRIANRTFIDITNEHTIKYSVKEGYWLKVFYYSAANESSFISTPYWLTGTGTLNKAGNFMRICISTVNDTEHLVPTDCSNVRVWSVKTLLSDNPALFSAGSLTDTGSFIGSDKRIATSNFIDISWDDSLTYSVDDGYCFWVMYYSAASADHFLSYEGGQSGLTTFGSLTIPADTTHVRICVSTVGDTTALTAGACKHVSIKKKPTRYIDWIENYTTQTTQTIEFGENLLDFSEHADADEIVTCLIPLGKTKEKVDGQPYTPGRINIAEDINVNGGELYVIYNPNNVQDPLSDPLHPINQFGRVWKTEVWEDETDPTTLKQLGQDWINAHGSAIANITVTAVDLAFTGADVEKIRVGDWVRVMSPPHGISEPVQCTKIVYDLLFPDKTEYTFGSIQKTISDQTSRHSKKYVQTADIKKTQAQAAKAEKTANAAKEKADRSSAKASSASSKADTAIGDSSQALSGVENLDEMVNQYSNYFSVSDIGQDFDLVNTLNNGSIVESIIDTIAPKVFDVTAIGKRFGIDLDPDEVSSLSALLEPLGLNISMLSPDGQINYDAVMSVISAEVGFLKDATTEIVNTISSGIGINIDLSQIWSGRIKSSTNHGGGGGGGGINTQE